MLVASSCAGMGMDVGNICLVVNIGIPRYDWELKQQSGRAGRDGSQAVCVNLVNCPVHIMEGGSYWGPTYISYLRGVM